MPGANGVFQMSELIQGSSSNISMLVNIITIIAISETLDSAAVYEELMIRIPTLPQKNLEL